MHASREGQRPGHLHTGRERGASEVVLAAALGGEEFLQLANFPIKLEDTITVKKNAVALTRGTDYFLRPSDGKLFFATPLSIGDAITADYNYFTGLIAQVQKVIDGDPADRVNFEGVRAAGVEVRVLAPIVVIQSVSVALVLLKGFTLANVRPLVDAAIQDYINNLGISNDVIYNELIDRIMGVDGVFDLTLSAPATNIVVLDNEIARTSSGNITIT
jgi:hypothetical protein